jgi:hypothetical protein
MPISVTESFFKNQYPDNLTLCGRLPKVTLQQEKQRLITDDACSFSK